MGNVTYVLDMTIFLLGDVLPSTLLSHLYASSKFVLYLQNGKERGSQGGGGAEVGLPSPLARLQIPEPRARPKRPSLDPLIESGDLFHRPGLKYWS